MGNVSLIQRRKQVISLANGQDIEIKFTLSAMAELEKKYGTVEQAFKELEKGSFTVILNLLWVGTLHSKPEFTEEELGHWIELRDLEYLSKALNEAMESDLPQEADNSPN